MNERAESLCGGPHTYLIDGVERCAWCAEYFCERHLHRGEEVLCYLCFKDATREEE